jgi:KDO2-lipid IV(A) lauroyltransferase
MWLVPHFAGWTWPGPGLTLLFQKAGAWSIYQRQSNAVFDAALMRGRGRFGNAVFVNRHDGIRPLIRAIQQGYGFFNAARHGLRPQGLGLRALLRRAGLHAAGAFAKLARSLDMVVQPVVARCCRAGGLCARALPAAGPTTPATMRWPMPARMNALDRGEIRELPAQYLWVHKRFKTRPEGEPRSTEPAVRRARAWPRRG